jgi:hypothetical protein
MLVVRLVLFSVSVGFALTATFTNSTLSTSNETGAAVILPEAPEWSPKILRPALKSDYGVYARYPVSGFNITQPYPGEAIDGWALQIVVRPIVRMNASAGTGRLPRHDVGLRGLLVLQPPLELVASQISQRGFYEPHAS